MNDSKRRILEMLSEGKVSADEADRLLTLVENPAKDAPQGSSAGESAEELGERMGELGERIGEDVRTHVEGLGEHIRESVQNRMEAVRDRIQEEVELRVESRFGDDDDEDEDEDEDDYDHHHNHMGHEHDIESNGKRRSETREDSFNVGSSPKLVVENFNGTVELEAGSDDAIHVEAKLKGADQIDYEARYEGETVYVVAKKKRGFSFRFHRVGASLSIVAPAQTEIDLSSSNGQIEVKGIEGSGPVITSNGKIVLEKMKGDHEVTTSNGRIEITEMVGNATIQTSNGRVSLQDVKGAFSAVTSNGTISFKGELADDSKHRFETSNGSVKIQLSGVPNFKLDAKTSNGSINSELALQEVSSNDRRHLAGTVGYGGGELVVRTSNGSVSIE